MKIGVSFDGFSTFSDALTFAREAAAAGASGLWMADHLGFREPMVSCIAFAMATESIRVIPTAVSPYLRHPMPTAMSLATLAEAAPGRVGIALGIGNPLFLGESGETPDKPVRVAQEFVGALRALWSGEPVHMDALRFRLNGARMMFKPAQPIPIYLAPIKEQMLKLAGKIADGVVLSAGLTTEWVRQSLAMTRAGADQAGRDYNALHTAGYISFLAARDRGEAIAKVKRQLSFIMRNRYLQDNIASSGIIVDQDAIIAAMSARDFERAQSLIPDEAVDRFAIAGTVNDCCDKLKQYADAGLKEPVLLMAGTLDDQRQGLKVIRDMEGIAQG
jgi:5,10-methylenetetrahydromethanopterin reductase